MARLIYLMNVSLDGYVNTPSGSPDFDVEFDDEIHRWFNEQMRKTAVSVYGRRIYETMAAYWPTALEDPDLAEVHREFATLWNATPKIVFSSTLTSVIEGAELRRDDPVEAIQGLRDRFDGELAIGGPTLATPFIERGLIDEYRLVVHPVVIGGGTPYFPPLDRTLRLELIDERRFTTGALFLAYRPADGPAG